MKSSYSATATAQLLGTLRRMEHLHQYKAICRNLYMNPEGAFVPTSS
jgi:hypothetical protein